MLLFGLNHFYYWKFNCPSTTQGLDGGKVLLRLAHLYEVYICPLLCSLPTFMLKSFSILILSVCLL